MSRKDRWSSALYFTSGTLSAFFATFFMIVDIVVFLCAVYSTRYPTDEFYVYFVAVGYMLAILVVPLRSLVPITLTTAALVLNRRKIFTILSFVISLVDAGLLRITWLL